MFARAQKVLKTARRCALGAVWLASLIRSVSCALTYKKTTRIFNFPDKYDYEYSTNQTRAGALETRTVLIKEKKKQYNRKINKEQVNK